jgi:hypothetical protein
MLVVSGATIRSTAGCRPRDAARAVTLPPSPHRGRGAGGGGAPRPSRCNTACHSQPHGDSVRRGSPDPAANSHFVPLPVTIEPVFAVRLRNRPVTTHTLDSVRPQEKSGVISPFSVRRGSPDPAESPTGGLPRHCRLGALRPNPPPRRRPQVSRATHPPPRRSRQRPARSHRCRLTAASRAVIRDQPVRSASVPRSM